MRGDSARTFLLRQSALLGAALCALCLAPARAAENDEAENLRKELNALVDQQPEDVATLLRGWLVEPPR